MNYLLCFSFYVLVLSKLTAERVTESRGSHLTEAVRDRCSLESITQPTWNSRGGLELCRVFLFLGV